MCHQRSFPTLLSLWLILFWTPANWTWSVTLKGSVSSATGPVRCARVLAYLGTDSSTTWEATTDTLGRFQIDVSTEVEHPTENPETFQLSQNYPNPFLSQTAIPYSIGSRTVGQITIYDLLGRQVKQFTIGDRLPAIGSVVWDGDNLLGRRVSPGIYFAVLVVGKESRARKMILCKGPVQQFGPTSTWSLRGSGEATVPRCPETTAAYLSVRLISTESTTPPFVEELITNIPAVSDTTIHFLVDELNDLTLCYNRPSHGYGKIYLNNALGTHPREISSFGSFTDEYPQFSPNGRFVAYHQSRPIYGPATIVHDLALETYTDVTSDGGACQTNPFWTPDGKLFFSYVRPLGTPPATFLMGPTGQDKKEIMDSAATDVFFLHDGTHYVYVMQESRVYLSNIEGMTNEFLCDLRQVLNADVAVEDFSPTSQDILIVYRQHIDSTSGIATYNVGTRNTRIRAIEEQGYTFFQACLSSDGLRIAVVEHSNQDEYLSLVQDSGKTRLVRIPISEPQVLFSYNPMRFSLDGGLIAYSNQHFQAGPWLTWVEKLYTVRVADGRERIIDFGWYPSWRNP